MTTIPTARAAATRRGAARSSTCARATALPAMGVPWAAAGRSVADLVAGARRLRLRRDHRPRPARRGRSTALTPYRMRDQRHPSRILFGRDDGRDRGLSARRRPGDLPGRQRLLLGRRARAKDEPHCMEVRKLDTGSRAWQAEPGEGYLASTGETIGPVALARARAAEDRRRRLHLRGHGRKPALRADAGQLPPPRRLDLRRHRRGRDRSAISASASAAPPASKSTATTWRSARRRTRCCWPSSDGHSDNYPLVSEEVTYAFPGRGGTQDPQVRADMIYFTTRQ